MTDPASRTASLDALLRALQSAQRGDFSARLGAPEGDAVMADIARAFNAMADQASAATSEVTRVAREIHRDGSLGVQVSLPGSEGAWRAMADDVNALAEGLTAQVRDIAMVTTAVARGDLSPRLTVDAAGEVLALTRTINAMIDQLQSFSAQVSRVTRSLDAQGTRAPASERTDVAGVWKDFTDNVGLAEQVAQVSRYKSEFLAHMSHELRTPLNSLLVLAKLLADNQEATLSPRQVQYARTIYDAGGDLLALISEILDHARIEAGQMRIETHDVEIDEIRGLLERSFGQVAAQRNLSFVIEVAPDAPTRIYTDAQRLQQVLLNLLSNAFKFTEHGGVTVRITRDDATATLSFAVRDTGIGIDPARHAQIFQAFQQADGSTSRRYGGTGLGLSISRGIAELLGGALRVESAPGEGSTFTLTLPLHAERARAEQDVTRHEWIAPAEPTAPPRADTTLAGRKALVIDDDVRNIFSLASVLESQDMQIVFAEGGRQGLDALQRTPDVDVVLMDVMMPDLDGYAAMRLIREDPRHGALPIIAVTAKALPGDRARCLDAGASEYLSKPVDTAALLALIRRLLAR